MLLLFVFFLKLVRSKRDINQRFFFLWLVFVLAAGRSDSSLFKRFLFL